MKNWQRLLVRMAKRKFPDEVRHWGDKEILERWTMDGAFKKGFNKSAAHVLAELSLNSETNEHQAERQEILERSYAKERGEDEEKAEDATKEESTPPSFQSEYSRYF